MKFIRWMVTFHVVLLCYLSWNPSFTQSEHDEAIYLGAGSVIWHTGEVANKMTEAHPPLTYYFNSLLLGANPIDWEKRTDWLEGAKKIEDSKEREHSLHFLESIGTDIVNQTRAAGKSVAAVLFRARLPYVALSLAFLCYLIYACRNLDLNLRRLVVSLYAISPIVLSLAPGVMTDLPMVIFCMAALFSLRDFLKAPSWRQLAWAGFWQGLALGSKVSAVLLVPCGVVVVAWSCFEHGAGLRRQMNLFSRQVVVLFLMTFVTLWGVYGLQVDSLARVEKLHRAFPLHELEQMETPASYLEKNYPRLHHAKLPMVSFLMPVRLVFHRRHALNERTAVEGPFREWVESKWYPWTVVLTYFPLSFVLLLLFASIQVIRRKSQAFRRDWLPFVLFTMLYGWSAFTSNYLYGTRHVFPIFVPLLLWMALSLQTMGDSEKHRCRYVFAGLLGLLGLETALFLCTNHAWSLWMYA